MQGNLDEATRQLRLAVQNVGKLASTEPWQRHLDDLDLLAEQLIDIRQQVLLLELEVGPEPTDAPEPDLAS